ncbi:MAG: TonB C-terminal domain-containing protein [Kiritimatiellaeota bacterium]|nr:TonB C-terminal domain-containing protein [Kiritimatiellota bacterium]
MRWSCGLHGLLLMGAVMIPLLPHFRPREIPVMTEFTVVLVENLVESEPVQPASVQQEPVPLPMPDDPLPLPPPQEAVVIEKQKPKEPEKKPEPKPFEKGKRVTLPPKEDFTKLKPVTEKKLSQAEIKKLLEDGAKPGMKNQVPPDEVSRCLSMISQALRGAWVQPRVSDAGTRPSVLTIRLDSTGRIVEYRIRQSSGSTYFDQTVLKAAATCPPIHGLSAGFLKQYDTIPVEFVLQ